MLIRRGTHGALLKGHGDTSTFGVGLTWFCLFHLFSSVSSSCPVHICSGEFVANTRNLREGPYHPYCTQLDIYMKCIEQQAKNCHANLLFHGTKISVETMFSNNNCQEVLQLPPVEDPLENEVSYQSHRSPVDPCSFHGRSSSLAHCGLFGDPHLKTFNNTFQTCRVRGAWPMLSSAHLSIQVTNDAVGAGDLKATATTKVTVLIKENEECGIAKTYEASRDELPKAFVDGTTFSGSDRHNPYAQVIEALPGQHVIIKVKTINSTVNIRKVGKYLTVSVTAPLEIVESMRGDMQLCDQGCPDSEVLEAESSKQFKSTRMSQYKAELLCTEYNITDFYLDSCVFDLITTGDVSFRDAAAMALSDMWNNDPKASYLILKNCTSWPCLGHSTNNASDIKMVTWAFIISFLSMFIL